MSDCGLCFFLPAGYYTGYEAYYDPNAYQAYAAAQATASVPPPQPPTGPPPPAEQPPATAQPESAPGAENEEKENVKEAEEDIQVLCLAIPYLFAIPSS